MLQRDLYAVGARIRMLQPTLTELEGRVVEALLQPSFGPETSLKDISSAADASEAMIVKTAKKLGFSGFRDCRARLGEYHSLPSTSLHQEVRPTDSSVQILSKVFNTAIQAIQETLAIIDVKIFERVVQSLFDARNRDLYGVGGSAQIAKDVSHKFLRIGVRSAVYDDAHMMLMSASLLGRGDIAIGFSHSGRTTAVIDALRLARESGATTIAITNFAGSPLTKVAELVLCSTARGSPLLGENAAARVAQLNILDAIFAALAQKDYESAEDNLRRTSQAVRSKREK
ncbi:MurR/RpiR family transcriptional regulator [Tanticharoenia sakaeratensis]|jgi:RpiR family transcriptional regulator, repressor of rpiB and als operon|uniref:Sugar isomerase n=1 Tax=Tanticharoenia sakaeratensis NBRC 103193 TaxID=1231623 RepID=A0A0D6MHK4_9PROT|nr:MurR/RpiR family transcriptional regulator [Tanticharoenia sakaeratensis]GAN53129.1 sugar isomerase [Tanticharoenia sakaeratensis NBRC 103193]GBQ20574.1 RpiR family transcriptional regulator [Tanticharoenia sakaeratensis NBRC 103193]